MILRLSKKMWICYGFHFVVHLLFKILSVENVTKATFTDHLVFRAILLHYHKKTFFHWTTVAYRRNIHRKIQCVYTAQWALWICEFRTSTFSCAIIFAIVSEPYLIFQLHEHSVASDRAQIVRGDLEQIHYKIFFFKMLCFYSN